MQIEEKQPSGVPVLARGFRPFFLFAGIAAVVLMAFWVLILSGATGGLADFAAYYGIFLWHGHEMIFGYTIAVIAGFLLTATRNWTGQETCTPESLLVLISFWLLGRIVPVLTDHGSLIAAADLAFIPLLIVFLAIPLIRAKNYRNLFFIPLLGVFFLANLSIHLEANGYLEGVAFKAERFILVMTLLMIAIVGGRIIPLFTKSATPGYSGKSLPLLEKCAVVSLLIFAVVYGFFAEQVWLLTGAAGFAAVSHLLRLWFWFDKKLLGNPMLWILHLAYLWLGIGLILFGLEAHFQLLAKPAIHAVGIGTVATITLGMMARVSLGHTARMLVASPMVVTAFVALLAGALMRVFGPLIMPSEYTLVMQISGALWVVCFLLYVVAFTPVLFSQRADGKQG